jgi:hypothetical protein
MKQFKKTTIALWGLTALIGYKICFSEEIYRSVTIIGHSPTTSISSSSINLNGTVKQSTITSSSSGSSTLIMHSNTINVDPNGLYPNNPRIAGSAIILKSNGQILDKTIPSIPAITPLPAIIPVTASLADKQVEDKQVEDKQVTDSAKTLTDKNVTDKQVEDKQVEDLNLKKSY